MPEDYDAEGEERPHLDADPPEEDTARRFLCGGCRSPVLICRRCDRGQIYCAGGCAREARRASLRRAGGAWQRSRRGRFLHAMRSRRWRARAKNVTHQGSAGPREAVLLPQGPPARVAEASEAASGGTPDRPPLGGQGEHRCHWCGRPVSPFVRRGFLRRRRVHPIPSIKGHAHGHPP